MDQYGYPALSCCLSFPYSNSGYCKKHYQLHLEPVIKQEIREEIY